MPRTFFLVLVVLSTAVQARAEDWPSDRADAARSGYTAEQLPASLGRRWTVSTDLPQSAWPSIERMPFDRAPHLVAAGGKVYYGTTSDKVVARDAATGKVIWTTFTDGPVRFAPVVWRDWVFVASDDGFLYCLSSLDGRVVWKLRGGPRAEMLLGNDRMISRWPARGGPVVVDGIVYFAAGIWPTEGIFLYAIDAATGKQLWCNDKSGSIEMDQPHPTARAVSGVAAQGQLVVAGETLLVPTGRAVPAAFRRADGTLRYFHLQVNRGAGGSEVVAFDQYFVNSGALYARSDGRLRQILANDEARSATQPSAGNVPIAAHPRWIVYASGTALHAVDRRRLLENAEEASSMSARPTKPHESKTAKTRVKPLWTINLSDGPIASLIIAGDRVLAGGKDAVTAVDIESGTVRWRGPVSGTAWSMAVADGRLLVSTDRGVIRCFAAPVHGTPSDVASSSEPGRVGPETPGRHARALNGAKDAAIPRYAEAAEEIVRRSGISEGHCLDLGCGDGRLALELARRTKLRICAVDADPAKVAAARQMLDAAGLYGLRVSVLQADPAAVVLPNYFADLVVSGRSVTDGLDEATSSVITKTQRPYGGVACLGRPGEMRVSVRGPLEGAGAWTHLYAGPANTVCSEDLRLRSPLRMLWFRDTDFVMPSRHGRSPSPLVAEGRMFVGGMDGVRAVNIYNGSPLWEIPLKGLLKVYHQEHLGGVATTGSNMCAGRDCLYVHTGDRCLRLDAKTGRQLGSWETPRVDGKPGRWGIVAHDGGILFGTVANEKHVTTESWKAYLGKTDMTRLLSESSMLFALDDATGRLRWTFTPRHSIRHNTIAIGQGRVYLIDRPLAVMDTPWARAGKKKEVHPTGQLICLDAGTGRELWRNDEDIFGTLLALSEKHGVLLMSYQPTTFQLQSERGGRMAAFRIADGKRLWDEPAIYESRPILHDREIFAEPGRWDLLSGRRLPFEFSRSYGCGILAASKRLLVYRSATIAYYDLEAARKTENYGGIRPGCWINALPAGGLVLLADAASWCTCSYLNQATIALEPAP